LVAVTNTSEEAATMFHTDSYTLTPQDLLAYLHGQGVHTPPNAKIVLSVFENEHKMAQVDLLDAELTVAIEYDPPQAPVVSLPMPRVGSI